MSLSIDDLTQMRDTLIRARAKGVRTLQMGGERVEYKTDAEMAAAINDLDARIQRASGRGTAMVRFRAEPGS